MKKFLLSSALVVLGFSISTAQIVKQSEEQTSNQPIKTNKNSIGYFGVSYFTFDGFENWGLSLGSLKSNDFGFDGNLRTNFETHGNYNVDLGPNFSFGLYSKDKSNIFLTLGAGLSIRMQDEYKGSEVVEKQHHSLALGNYTTTYTVENWDENKFFFDAYLNARLTITYDWLAISGGYFYWAPKFKFGSDYKCDGWMISIGGNF